MKFFPLFNKKKEIFKNDKYKNKNILNEIKSIYILKKIFNNLTKINSLELIKHNKTLQKRLNINIINYKEHSEIYTPVEIEILTAENKYSQFIDENKVKEEPNYYHIYFDNNNKEEIKRVYLMKNEKVKKIKIIIDYPVLDFSNLFHNCFCI